LNSRPPSTRAAPLVELLLSLKGIGEDHRRCSPRPMPLQVELYGDNRFDQLLLGERGELLPLLLSGLLQLQGLRRDMGLPRHGDATEFGRERMSLPEWKARGW